MSGESVGCERRYRRRSVTRWTIRIGMGTLVLLALTSSQCFAPTYSDCAYRCGSDEPRCPPGYECRADNYCHKPDANNVCVFGIDLAGVLPDLGRPLDAQ